MTNSVRDRYEVAMLAWLDHKPGEAPEKGDALMVAAAAIVAEADAIISELLAGGGRARAADFVADRPLKPTRDSRGGVAHTGI